MAIEVSIPKEITEYKEKIMFGLSLRQLGCFSLATVLSVGVGLLCTKVFGMSMDDTSWIIILVVIPIMAFGFIKIDGRPFEKHMALYIRHKTGVNQLKYKPELIIDELEKLEKSEGESKYAWIFEKENKNSTNTRSKKQRKQDLQIRECEIFTVTKKARKEKSKRALRKIKAARQEYRAAKRRAKKEIKERSRSEKHARTN